MIKNSIIVTGLSTLIALLIGVPAAYAFSRLRFRGREQWSTTILSFRFMPPVAVAIPIFLMMREIGLEDSFTGLILPYVAFSLPLTVWIMIGFFDEIPRELDDAALVDGASRLGALVRVLLPLARPGMIVAAIFGVIFIWNEFLVGLYVITSPDKQTVPHRRLGAAHDAEPHRLEHRRRRRRADDHPDPDLLDLRPALHRPRHDRGRHPMTREGRMTDRIEQLQQGLAEAGVDALVLRLPENVLLTTEHWVQVAGLGAVVVPREGAATLIVPEAEEAEAREPLRGDVRTFPAGRTDRPPPGAGIAAHLRSRRRRARPDAAVAIGYEGSFESLCAADPRRRGERRRRCPPRR